jgi:hypothetical protein
MVASPGEAGSGGTAAAGGAIGGADGTAGAAGSGIGGHGPGGAGGSPGTGGVAGTTGSGGRGGAGGAGGTSGAGGAAGSAGAAPAIQVVAQCQSTVSGTTILVHFKIFNLSNMSIPFNTITARYFFTLEDPAMTVPIVEFDYVQSLAKTAVTTKATATYVEFGFTSSAGSLAAFDNISGTGEIQVRIHPPNYLPSAWDSDQTNDSSYKACTGTTYDPRPGFIGYVNGQQAWPAL